MISLLAVLALGFAIALFLPSVDFPRVFRRRIETRGSNNVLPDLFTTIASWTVELAEGLDSSELAVSLLGALISPDNGAALEFLELRDKLDVLLLESDAAHARQLDHAHDASALFLLVTCQNYAILSEIEQSAAVRSSESIVTNILKHFDRTNTGVDVLRQSEVLAALRCASRLINRSDGALAEHATVLLGTIVARLTANVTAICGSEAAMSLLFLEPGDLPLSITDGIANAALKFAGPVGIKTCASHSRLGARFTLLDQAVIALGAIKQAEGHVQIRLSDDSISSVEDVSVSLHRLAIAALRAATVTKRLSIEAISRLGSGGACDSSTFRASEPSRFSFQVVAGNDAAPALPLVCLTFPERVVSVDARSPVMFMNATILGASTHHRSFNLIDLLQETVNVNKSSQQLSRMQRLWSLTRQISRRIRQAVRPARLLPIVTASDDRGAPVEHVVLAPLRSPNSKRLGAPAIRASLGDATSAAEHTLNPTAFACRGDGNPLSMGTFAASLCFQDVITKALKLSFGEDVRVLEHNDDDAMPASDELLRALAATSRRFIWLPAQLRSNHSTVQRTHAAVSVEFAASHSWHELDLMRSRICGSGDSNQPWFHECCTSTKDALMPVFSCPVNTGANEISCSHVRDGFCDCISDGADEPESGVCADGYFFCKSGVRKVSNGILVGTVPVTTPNFIAAADAVRSGKVSTLWALGFIPSALVADGVNDCASGEDERPLA